jgi:LuxR family transcriptional regulator
MRAILDRAGYHVVECSRGETAINELAKGGFDLVIMDLNLPDISGVDVLQSPELAPKPLPPVVGITGALTPQVQERAIAAGMCRVLEKPISYEQLTEAAAVAVNIGRSIRHADDEGVPVIDLVTLSQVRALQDEALAQGFINQAILDARRCVVDLESTAKRRDFAAWRKHAQTLAGVALTIGARRLASSIDTALASAENELRNSIGGFTLLFSELLDDAAFALANWLTDFGGASGLAQRRSLQAKRRLPHSLTEREVSVLKWTAAGKTSAEIGIILGISTRTVNFHITTALTKLDAVNKTQAVVKAVMLGLLVVDGVNGDSRHPTQEAGDQD